MYNFKEIMRIKTIQYVPQKPMQQNFTVSLLYAKFNFASN